MNLVLTYCWREWRAQRAVLLAYTGMGLAALCLVFLLLPEHWWHPDGQRAEALSWFLVVGVVGIVAFATPTLVRGEFGAKDDQFVRRMPGALLPSFGGKLLFLALAALAMPLVCLLVGEGFLLAIDQPWYDLFTWRYDGTVEFQWPWPTLIAGYAALLVPWVWAIGAWLPGGRMATGGCVVFVLLLALAVIAVLRQSPGIESGLAWWNWTWLVPVLGLAVAAVSWVRGRRGGGPLRSARFGLAAVGIGLAPPSAWLGARVWDYHHPDLQRLESLYVHGMTPDRAVLLAHGSENPHYNSVPVRIDLRDGSAAQLGGINDAFHVVRGSRPRTAWPPGCGRYWSNERYVAGCIESTLLDLTDGSTASAPWDKERGEPVLPPTTAATVEAETREAVVFLAPGGRRAWFEADEVCIERDGGVDRVRWKGELPRHVGALGHGLRAYFAETTVLFDLATHRQFEAKRDDAHWFVQGTHLWAKTNGAYGWHRDRGDDGAAEPIAELAGCGILGLLDDERLLCQRIPKKAVAEPAPTRLFVWRVTDGAITELSPPIELPSLGFSVAAPFGDTTSLLPRDPAGRIWLMHRTAKTQSFLLLDPTSLTFTVPKLDTGRAPEGDRRLLAWPDASTVVMQEQATIQRIDLTTGARTQLFPRRP
jgi:hypothetical protein